MNDDLKRYQSILNEMDERSLEQKLIDLYMNSATLAPVRSEAKKELSKRGFGFETGMPEKRLFDPKIAYNLGKKFGFLKSLGEEKQILEADDHTEWYRKSKKP